MIEFGVRIDCLENLENILQHSFLPANKTDLTIYNEMLKWMCLFQKVNIKYIYFGSEFCNKKSFSIFEWKKVASFCEENNKILSMVFPPQDDFTILRTISIIDKICSEYINLRIEVVVNDYGLLQAINDQLDIRLKNVRIGRILDKTYHDARLREEDLIQLYTNCNMKWYENSSLISEMKKRIYNRYSISGIDIDIPSISSALKKIDEDSFDIGMFVPYSFTTSGGICKMQNIDIEGCYKFHNYKKICNKKCSNFCETMKKKVIDVNLFDDKKYRNIEVYGKGNTIFYIPICNNDGIDNIKINRIIFEPYLMI